MCALWITLLRVTGALGWGCSRAYRSADVSRWQDRARWALGDLELSLPLDARPVGRVTSSSRSVMNGFSDEVLLDLLVGTEVLRGRAEFAEVERLLAMGMSPRDARFRGYWYRAVFSSDSLRSSVRRANRSLRVSWMARPTAGCMLLVLVVGLVLFHVLAGTEEFLKLVGTDKNKVITLTPHGKLKHV